MQTWWLSFVDPARPAGERFLGVCVVDVDEEDAEAAERTLPPTALPGAKWLAAASQMAWLMKCNPGGEVQATCITDLDFAAILPRNRLMQVPELRSLSATPDTSSRSRGTSHRRSKSPGR